MVSIPCAVYRSMIRISKKHDSEVVNHLQSGLLTFKDSKSQLYDFKYIREDQLFFIYGPYANETANMLSYTKCLIRDGKKTDYTMERLFLAHRELPNFFIAKEDYWQKRFKEAGVPVVGDDIKSQVGATIVHRVLTRLFQDRGVKIDNTYQLNFGGNTDFFNMLERERLLSKKISKTNAVKSQLEQEINSDNIHIGPSDHVPWLEDRKWAYIRIEGTSFGDLPLNVELKLEVEDSPNSAGVAIDAIRCAMIAKDRGVSGSVDSASAYFMKSPSIQYTDEEARQMVQDFADNKNQSKSNKSRLDQ